MTLTHNCQRWMQSWVTCKHTHSQLMHSQVIWHMVYVYSIPAMRNWVTTVYLRCHHFLTLRGTGISYEDTIEVQPSNFAVTFSNSEGKDLQTMRRSVFDWHILFSSCKFNSVISCAFWIICLARALLPLRSGVTYPSLGTYSLLCL